MIGQKIFRPRWVRKFAKKDDGNGTIEFVIALPLFMMLFSLVFEAGVLSTRQVVLEHGLNQTVRDVRIGTIPDPTHEALLDRICDYAGIIPDCINQVRLEMVSGDIKNWDDTKLNAGIDCRDRSEGKGKALKKFTNTGSNNELMFLRVCALFDPMMLYMGLGEVIPKESGDAYALIATSGYVLEPFQ